MKVKELELATLQQTDVVAVNLKHIMELQSTREIREADFCCDK